MNDTALNRSGEESGEFHSALSPDKMLTSAVDAVDLALQNLYEARNQDQKGDREDRLLQDLAELSNKMQVINHTPETAYLMELTIAKVMNHPSLLTMDPNKKERVHSLLAVMAHYIVNCLVEVRNTIDDSLTNLSQTYRTLTGQSLEMDEVDSAVGRSGLALAEVVSPESKTAEETGGTTENGGSGI